MKQVFPVSDSAPPSTAKASDVKAWPVVTDFERQVYGVLGLPFDVVTQAQAVQRIRESAQLGKRCFFFNTQS